MRITSVSIQGFRAIDEIKLDFRDELGIPMNVVTLAGPNGCGKTSVLYAITNALRGVFGYRTHDVPAPTRDDLRRSSQGSEWTTRRADVRVDVEIRFSDEEQQNIRSALALLNKHPPPQLPNGALTVHWTYPPPVNQDGQRPNLNYADISPSLPNIRSWLMAKSWAIKGWKDGIPGIAEHLHKLGGLHFFPQDRDLRQRVGAMLTGRIDDARSRERPTVHDVLDEFSRRFAKASVNDPNNWESHVKHLYKAICSPKEYVGFLYREETPEGTPVFSDGPYRYPLTHAASGEHVILEYILELCRFGPLNRSIILIDEPEVHLHPLWLRRFYLSLPKFGDDNQFVLTTHSPELRQRASSDNSLVELGTLEDGK
jgi:hypothetical protein